MINIVFDFVAGIIAIWVAVVFHELGHYVAAKRYDKLAYMGKDKKNYYVKFSNLLTKEQKLEIYRAGIWAGVVPIFCLWFINGYVAVFLLLAYSVGCINDIKKIEELKGKPVKEVKEE